MGDPRVLSIVNDVAPLLSIIYQPGLSNLRELARPSACGPSARLSLRPLFAGPSNCRRVRAGNYRNDEIKWLKMPPHDSDKCPGQ